MPERGAKACLCASLGDLACIPMGGDGLDERFFATIEHVADHGSELWWLYLSRCEACGQDWMIAQEERIYDDYFLRRLPRADTETILGGGHWPADFLSYEKVLATGRARSTACQFFDPLSPDLIRTARDLRRDRPDITSTEVGELLGINAVHAEELLRPMGLIRAWLWRRRRGIRYFPA